MNRVLHSLKEGKVLDHFVVVGDGSRLSAVDDGVPLTPQYILALALFHTGEGNRDAFRQVYELTSSRLFGICFRVCGDYAIAQDVLHDVYLTVWGQYIERTQIYAKRRQPRSGVGKHLFVAH